jgi:hypothetical protein
MMLRPILIALLIWLLWRVLRRVFLPAQHPGGPGAPRGDGRRRDARYRDGNAVDAEYEELDEPPKP